jgi:hypothetical protein
VRERFLLTLVSAGVPVDRCPAAVGPGTVRGDLTFVGNPTQAQLDACDAVIAAFDWSDAAHAVWLNARSRDAAKSQFDLTDAQGKVLRALVKVLIDEVNLLRQWVAAFKVETAAASTLANLKTRVATLPATPDRTLQQAKTAIAAAIDAGEAD